MSRMLEGKVALITGASQGLGLEIARKYLHAGASVGMCARHADLLGIARSELENEIAGNGRICALATDVSREDDVKAFVDHTRQTFGRIDILVNNAGVYGPKGAAEDTEWSAWKRAIEVNLLGSVICCRAVLPLFKEQRYGKIVQISGGGATSPLPFISAYATSKAAVIRFIETLAEETRGQGIDINAIAPGALNTRMLDEVLEAGPDAVGRSYYERALEQQASGGAPLSLGADLAVFLGSAESDGITGKLISALWDDWEKLQTHRTELASSDIYTLRRITPEDRGKSWESDS